MVLFFPQEPVITHQKLGVCAATSFSGQQDFWRISAIENKNLIANLGNIFGFIMICCDHLSTCSLWQTGNNVVFINFCNLKVHFVFFFWYDGMRRALEEPAVIVMDYTSYHSRTENKLPKLYWQKGAYTSVYGRTWDLRQHWSYWKEHKITTHTDNPGELAIQKEVRTRMKNTEVKQVSLWYLSIIHNNVSK